MKQNKNNECSPEVDMKDTEEEFDSLMDSHEITKGTNENQCAMKILLLLN